MSELKKLVEACNNRHLDEFTAQVLADNGYPSVPRNEVYNEVFEQAENFKKYSE